MLVRNPFIFVKYCIQTNLNNIAVSYIRGILTRDAQDRNALGRNDGANKRAKRKKQMLKVGHGGTLDPLASGKLFWFVNPTTALISN